MGWLKKRVASLLGKPDGDAHDKKHHGHPFQTDFSELIDNIDTSWSGKGGQHYDPYNWEAPAQRAPSRSGSGRSGRLPMQRRPQGWQPQAARLPCAGLPAAPVEACCAAEQQQQQQQQQQEADAGIHAEPEPSPSPSPAGPLHRSGSAPCTITVAQQHRQKEATCDSASSMLAGAEGCAPKSPAAAASESVTPLRQPQPQEPQQQQQPGQPQPPARRASKPVRAGGSTLSAALSVCAAPPQSADLAAVAASPDDGQRRSLEHPSQAILATLSRSMPSSREPSTHGSRSAATELKREAGEAKERRRRQQQQQQEEAGVRQAEAAERQRNASSLRSGSGRPATAPLPCSREGSQHRATAYGELACLPEGLSAREEEGDRQGPPGSLPAGCSESTLCSPGAVSLLSLQLRGPSAAGSMGASREGSFRPLHRQLSAGGLSAALSREASVRAGTLQRNSAARSREGSARGPALCDLQRAAEGGWPPQLPSREASSRGGHLSRDGSSRNGNWCLLHPVTEAAPYHGVPLPAPRFGEASSWTHRITSFPTGGAAAAPPLAAGGPALDKSSRGSSRRRLESKAQQVYSVDAVELTAALSVLALNQPASPSPASPAVPEPPPRLPAPPPQPQPQQQRQQQQQQQHCQASMPSSSAGGSSLHGRRSVLVGDPDWATQQGSAWDGDGPSGQARGGSLAAPAGKLAAKGGGDDEAEGGGEGGKAVAGCEKGQAEQKVEWNRRFVRRWKAVKKRARLQGMGLRSLWKVNSPTDRHEPDELLVDLPQNDMAWPRFWSPPHPQGMPVGRAHASRNDIRRSPSLSTMLLGEVAEVT